jgi:co-chaperonin GroES (HSP10)
MSYNTKGLDFLPFGNNLLVLPDEVSEMTAGGIALPDSAKPKAVLVKVLRVGLGQKYAPDMPEVPCQAREGDYLLVPPHAAQPISLLDGTVLHVIQEGNVFGAFRYAETVEETPAATEAPEAEHSIFPVVTENPDGTTSVAS